MLTAIVIPCLNEQVDIPAAAHSLGFGVGIAATPDDTLLVLVDNGSTDGTLRALAAIKRASRAGAVAVVQERERGYVPPRAKGVEVVARIARTRGIAASEVLILQGDADTRYHGGYVDAFRNAAGAARRPALFEGLAHPPHRFLREHPGYQQLADAVDKEMAPFLVDDEFDVIVDDKVCGYSLANYRKWGGHRRDYRSSGKEIYAETSRLLLRAKRAGAEHVRVVGAVATPSRRKILRNPIRHFATAGFPREEAWWRAWSSRYEGPRELSAFEQQDARTVLNSAIKARMTHLLALMSALPLMVAGPVEIAEAKRNERLHPLVDRFLIDMAARPTSFDVPILFDLVLGAVDAWQDWNSDTRILLPVGHQPQ
ncbi:glycosyltransferase family 2 protein [Prosthecodimorpha staleyi]|uniref:Glycosyltransferase n=1 Tax=Prosthecodimorpha staleyi TaxID=2840188 RepID=A0A947GK45_9HYPH|nr:glycosyltransferase [Prosthecodimorpha staleyi]MBT9293119.1 glycosyltransferase [Prosthecodimorpha staleyi]